ncbi:unnamed protein product [Vitrella brassicaformis CCMP3155]|uniref:Protein kinase domain-containing protein n=1 Tax=Vitrella brassicaformis (strain CCMP3155) TaxID=1169540 RepID=A0A0G4EYW4_VITBC|nr:unnamed protein product [Vitrella brassicaformis CCMP3155]|eukprot:CEM04357.1 unnamed protein product [Vitrella brassicaformis CCMP3155]
MIHAPHDDDGMCEEVVQAVRSANLLVDTSVSMREGLQGCAEVLFNQTTHSHIAYKVFKTYETDEPRDAEGFVRNGWDISAAAGVSHENVVSAPHILKVRTPYATVKAIVMHYCNGGTLADREFVLVPLLRQALAALKHLHEKGIAHTDVLGSRECPGGNLGIVMDAATRQARLVLLDLDRAERHDPTAKDFAAEAQGDCEDLGTVFDHLLGETRSLVCAEIVRRLENGLYSAKKALDDLERRWTPRHGHKAAQPRPAKSQQKPSHLKPLTVAPSSTHTHGARQWVGHLVGRATAAIPSHEELKRREDRTWRGTWRGGRVAGARLKVDTGRGGVAAVAAVVAAAGGAAPAPPPQTRAGGDHWTCKMSSLETLHQMRCIHRDQSLKNLIVGPRDPQALGVYVVDYTRSFRAGIQDHGARFVGRQSTMKGTLLYAGEWSVKSIETSYRDDLMTCFWALVHVMDQITSREPGTPPTVSAAWGATGRRCGRPHDDSSTPDELTSPSSIRMAFEDGMLDLYDTLTGLPFGALTASTYDKIFGHIDATIRLFESLPRQCSFGDVAQNGICSRPGPQQV